MTACLSGAPPTPPDLSETPLALLIKAGLPVYHFAKNGEPPMFLTPEGNQRTE